MDIQKAAVEATGYEVLRAAKEARQWAVVDLSAFEGLPDKRAVVRFTDEPLASFVARDVGRSDAQD